MNYEDLKNNEIDLIKVTWNSKDSRGELDMSGDGSSTFEEAVASLPECLWEVIEVCDGDVEHVDGIMNGYFQIYVSRFEGEDFSENFHCRDISLDGAPEAVIGAIQRAENWRSEKDDEEDE